MTKQIPPSIKDESIRRFIQLLLAELEELKLRVKALEG
jgi:hypothetical protein